MGDKRQWSASAQLLTILHVKPFESSRSIPLQMATGCTRTPASRKLSWPFVSHAPHSHRRCSQLAQLELAQLVLTTQNVFSTNRSTAQVYSRSGHLPKHRHNRLQEIPDGPPPRPKAGDAKVQDTFHEAPVKEISHRRRASVEGYSQRIERNRWIGPEPSLWPPSTRVGNHTLEEQRDDVLDIGATTEVALVIVEIMLQWRG